MIFDWAKRIIPLANVNKTGIFFDVMLDLRKSIEIIIYKVFFDFR